MVPSQGQAAGLELATGRIHTIDRVLVDEPFTELDQAFVERDLRAIVQDLRGHGDVREAVPDVTHAVATRDLRLDITAAERASYALAHLEHADGLAATDVDCLPHGLL